jgi:hypothetical protein
VLQIGFPTPPRIFQIFPPCLGYFSRVSNRFRSYLKLEKTLTCGALQSVALSSRFALWLAAMGGAIRTRAAWVFRRRLPCLKPHRRRLPCPKPTVASPHAPPPQPRSDASPTSPQFRPSCLSTASLPRSETTRCHCSGKLLHRRVFTPSRPSLTALLLLRRSPQRREALVSHVTEHRVAGCLTIAPLFLYPGELTAPSMLL